jgi:hypothetical protein
MQMCAEFYDSIRDPITLYFTEKIQKTVSHRTVIQLFMKNSTPHHHEETLATRKRKESEENLKKMLHEHDDKVRIEKKSSSVAYFQRAPSNLRRCSGHTV